jgi:hypothetical protein
MIVMDYSSQRVVEAGNSLRCHVFKELIKPGITQKDILKVLDQYGPYDIIRSDFGEGTYQLYISFTDVKTREMFGGRYIILYFSDNLYTGAGLPDGIGDFLPVCKPE